MKRFVSPHLVVVSFVLGLSPSLASALHPVTDVTVDHYRILPRFSRMHASGDFTDFPHPPPPTEFILSGEYDLRRVDFGHAYEGRASFDNAEVWASPVCPDVCIALAIVFDADEILNLEGLHGEQLPVLAPFDIYHFTGTVQNGSPIDLYAAVLGPWMYVRGQTRPAPDSADARGLSVHWLARTSPFADFNGDSVVDAADYVLLRNAETSGLGSEEGMAGVSYEDWRHQFGETIPDLALMEATLSAASGTVLAPAGVPEPTTALAAVVGVVILAIRRRRARGD